MVSLKKHPYNLKSNIHEYVLLYLYGKKIYTEVFVCTGPGIPYHSLWDNKNGRGTKTHQELVFSALKHKVDVYICKICYMSNCRAEDSGRQQSVHQSDI